MASKLQEFELDFLSSITSSLLANIISSYYGVDKKTRQKKEFQKRCDVFHAEIAPHIINEVISSHLPHVFTKLERIDIPQDSLIAPYIDIAGAHKPSISNALATEIPSQHHDHKFLNWLKNELGKRVDNDPTFSIHSIRSSGEINVGASDYYSTVSTCDKNYYDLIRYFPLNKRKGAMFAYKNDPKIIRWLISLEKIVEKKSFSHYHASIGCSVLTVMKSSDGVYKYPIKVNSQEKGSGVCDSHVIPSFMFQPISKIVSEQERELDLETSVLKEYGEELLNIEGLESAETVDVMRRIISENKHLKKIKKQLNNGNALLEITGLILDIYRLRPEITFLLILNDSVYSKHIDPNWETEGKSLETYPLDCDDTYHKLISDSESPLCAPGLASLVNGRSRALAYLAKLAKH